MRAAFSTGHIKITKPKGVEEGSEIRVIWPCSIANEDAIVSEVSESSIKLDYRSIPGQQKCILGRKGFQLSAQCQLGDAVQKNRIVAAVVPIHFTPEKTGPVEEKYFQDQLQSVALDERYAAAKALRFRGFTFSHEKLLERMLDQAEDIYVQLEAAAASAAHGAEQGWVYLTRTVDSPYLTVQLETVIVVSEIHTNLSESLLIRVLTDSNRDSEVRAGAAWGLGEFKSHKSAHALVNTFSLTTPEIKIEAARALLRIATYSEGDMSSLPLFPFGSFPQWKITDVVQLI